MGSSWRGNVWSSSSVFGSPAGLCFRFHLFLAYINDLPLYVKSKVCLFADDTVIYLATKSTNDCIQLQQDLLSLEKWESD